MESVPDETVSSRLVKLAELYISHTGNFFGESIVTWKEILARLFKLWTPVCCMLHGHVACRKSECVYLPGMVGTPA
jgi:hypothetical protein